MRTTVTALLLSIAAGAAWAQGPTTPERRLYSLGGGSDFRQGLRCTVLRDGTLVTLGDEWLGSGESTVARFFDGLGDQHRVPVTVDGDCAVSSDVAAHGDGLVVIWHSNCPPFELPGQAFAADGTPVGSRFEVASNGYPNGTHTVKGTPDGGFIVAWTQGEGSGLTNVWARRYSAAGVAGAPFRVNITGDGNSRVLGGYYVSSGLDVAPDGSFTVTWLKTTLNRQGRLGIFARRFDAVGTPLGPDIQVSASPDDLDPAVAVAADGTALVVWQRGLDGPADVYGRRYDAAGAPLGVEFRINAEDGRNIDPHPVAGVASSFTVAWRRASASTNPYHPALLTRTVAADGTLAGASALAGTTPAESAATASDGAGGFTLCWRGYAHLDFNGAVVRRYTAFAPAASTADAAASPQSNGNGIIDPGEHAVFRPTWRNHDTAPVAAFTGRALAFEGPDGPFYSIYDDTASYAPADAGGSTGCAAGGDCYELGVDGALYPGNRPAVHVDATLDERLSTGQLQRWRLHIGFSFLDVHPSSPYYRFVETLLHQGVTSGCSTQGTFAEFCPASAVTREQLAPFVLVAREGAGYKPDLTPGPQRFTDVPTSSPFYPFIEELARRGVVTGCTAGTFCPQRDVTRAEATVIVLRTLDPALVPPACGTPLFEDVPAGSPFCPWVEELARRGVVNGCAPGRFCPDAPVLREQMAVVLTQAFGLSAYGF